jgi:hypothetical protein
MRSKNLFPIPKCIIMGKIALKKGLIWQNSPKVMEDIIGSKEIMCSFDMKLFNCLDRVHLGKCISVWTTKGLN